jgi:hypothetical protein
MPDEQAKQTHAELHHCHLQRKAVFFEGPSPDEPQVEEGQVARFDKEALFVCRDVYEAYAVQEEQCLGD